MSDNALILLQGISFHRNGYGILENVDLSVEKGQIVTLVGPNGAGKSSLVKIALGLTKPDQGTITTCPELTIGYVPQSVNLDHSLPVSVKRFLELSGVTDNRLLDQTLELVGTNKLAEKALHEISGGELRRVLLARALLKSPDLLILDEPTSGVDISGQANLYTLIQSIRDRYQCGVLLVSHNLHIVMAATDRVVCLNRHLCCSGAPEDVQNHPEYLSLFGHHESTALGIYKHDHDHEHDLHGDIYDKDNSQLTGK